MEMWQTHDLIIAHKSLVNIFLKVLYFIVFFFLYFQHFVYLQTYERWNYCSIIIICAMRRFLIIHNISECGRKKLFWGFCQTFVTIKNPSAIIMFISQGNLNLICILFFKKKKCTFWWISSWIWRRSEFVLFLV